MFLILNLSYPETNRSLFFFLSHFALVFHYFKDQSFKRLVKFAGLRLVILLKRRLRHSSFPVNFTKFWRTLSLKNISGGCFCMLQWSPVVQGKYWSLPERIEMNENHKLIKRQSCHHIETSQFICSANQLIQIRLN